MVSTSQLQAYALWLNDRGLRHPRLRESARSDDSSNNAVKEAAPVRQTTRVMFVSDQELDPAEAELLTKMIGAMQLGPNDTQVTTLAGGRWEETLQAYTPEVLVALGSACARTLMNGGQPSRGSILTALNAHGLPLLATFHPRDLLKQPANKRLAWSDLQLVMAHLRERPC